MYRTLLCLTAAGVLAAADTPTPSVTDWVLPDGLLQVDAPKAGATWATALELPLVQSLVKTLEQESPDDFAEFQTWDGMLRQVESAVSVLGIPHGNDDPPVNAQVNLAQAVLDQFWSAMGGPEGEQQFSHNDMTVIRSGTALQFAAEAEPMAVEVREAAHDLLMSWNADALRVVLLEGHGSTDDVEFNTAIGLIPSGHYLIDVRPDQVSEQYLLDRHLQKDLGLQPIDAAALGVIPDNTFMAFAFGIAPQQTLEAFGDVGDRAEQTFDMQLQMMGQEATSDQLAQELSGTWLVWIGQGIPFPTVNIMIPGGSSQALTGLLSLPLGGAGIAPPAVGEVVQIPLAQFGIPNIPVPVVLARTADYWLLSTDMLMANKWAKGEATGSDAGAIDAELKAAIDAGALIAGASHTAGVAQWLNGFGAMVSMGDENVAAMITMFASAILNAPNGSLAVTDQPWGTHIGITSQTLGIPLMAATFGGFASESRGSARTTESMSKMKELSTVCVFYEVDNGAWPQDLTQAMTAMGDGFPPDFLESPNGKDVPMPHYLYIRPSPAPQSQQPVIIENPACSPDAEMLVAFADGHVEKMTGDDIDAIWAKAQALAGSDKALADGIEAADWAGVVPGLE